MIEPAPCKPGRMGLFYACMSPVAELAQYRLPPVLQLPRPTMDYSRRACSESSTGGRNYRRQMVGSYFPSMRYEEINPEFNLAAAAIKATGLQEEREPTATASMQEQGQELRKGHVYPPNDAINTRRFSFEILIGTKAREQAQECSPTRRSCINCSAQICHNAIAVYAAGHARLSSLGICSGTEDGILSPLDDSVFHDPNFVGINDLCANLCADCAAEDLSELVTTPSASGLDSHHANAGPEYIASLWDCINGGKERGKAGGGPGHSVCDAPSVPPHVIARTRFFITASSLRPPPS